jgi:hypothetical protein
MQPEAFTSVCGKGNNFLKLFSFFPRPPFLNISNEMMSGTNQVRLSSLYNVKITKVFNLEKIYCIYFMCVSGLPALCKCTTSLQCLGGQEKVMKPLELELQVFVSCHVGAGN